MPIWTASITNYFTGEQMPVVNGRFGGMAYTSLPLWSWEKEVHFPTREAAMEAVLAIARERGFEDKDVRVWWQ